jgi:hypothetical protein
LKLKLGGGAIHLSRVELTSVGCKNGEECDMHERYFIGVIRAGSELEGEGVQRSASKVDGGAAGRVGA